MSINFLTSAQSKSVQCCAGFPIVTERCIFSKSRDLDALEIKKGEVYKFLKVETFVNITTFIYKNKGDGIYIMNLRQTYTITFENSAYVSVVLSVDFGQCADCQCHCNIWQSGSLPGGASSSFHWIHS